MSFKVKKQKQPQKKVIENLSIDFLHEQKLAYFKNNKDLPGINDQMVEYFLNTCDILAEYHKKKDVITKINPYEMEVINHDIELERRYYEICNIDYKFGIKRTKSTICCEQEMDLSSESFYVCYLCGKVGEIFINGRTFKQTQETFVSAKFVYKRINYFNDWLKQIQASENSDIPNDVYLKVKDEIRMRNIDVNKIKPYLVKKILKEMKEPKYYENINLIISKLTNKPALRIPEHIQQKLKQMFDKIQEPYETLKIGTRTNLLSYSYLLYKFFELLDLREYLKHLQLLKSRDKILSHDVIWKKIIIEMQRKEGDSMWKFIPSC